MRAELLAFRAECAESVKRFENKVNEPNSVLEARNSKIQTLETEISSLKGQSKAIHDRFEEEIKGNAEELTSLKSKVETMGKKSVTQVGISTVSRKSNTKDMVKAIQVNGNPQRPSGGTPEHRCKSVKARKRGRSSRK